MLRWFLVKPERGFGEIFEICHADEECISEIYKITLLQFVSES
jgi:hypothetical protein